MPRETTHAAPSPHGLEPSTSPVWLPPFELALCTVFAALLVWKGLLPAWRVLNTDFPNYYLVARLFREGYSLDRIYDWIWLQRIKDHWGVDQSLVGFAGLTPFSALPVLPLAAFSALTAKRIWIVINLILLGASAELLHRSTVLGRRRIWLLTLLAVLPLRTSFLYGQMHLLVLFLLVLGFYLYRREQNVACGACIALAAALKVYPIAFVLYFLWKRKWRAAFSTIAATTVIAIATGALMGWGLLHIYAAQMLPRSLQGEVLDPYSLHAASGAALFHRLFLFEPDFNPAPLVSSPMLYALLYPLWQMAIFLPLLAALQTSPSEPDRDQMEWAAFLLALLVVSPVPSSYHFVVMILPIVLFVNTCLRRGQTAAALIASVLYLFISLADGFGGAAHRLHGPLQMFVAFSRLWLAIGLFALFIVCIRLRRHDEPASKTVPRPALLLLSIVGLAISFAGFRHHFLNRTLEMSRHLPSPSMTYLNTSPRPFSAGHLFVAMTPQGYRVLDAKGQHAMPQACTANASRTSDQLSYAVAPEGFLYIEVDDSLGSRIIRSSDFSNVVENAESPIISPDGNTLAFVRENNHGGSLWTTSATGQATRITPDGYDVREASFLSSGALMFLARQGHRDALFTLTPGTSPASFFMPNQAIASFVVSPDERSIAFTQLVRNRWQLSLLDTHSHRITQLTTEDCNAYTPTWSTLTQILYATDCGRGVGLTALATMDIPAR